MASSQIKLSNEQLQEKGLDICAKDLEDAFGVTDEWKLSIVDTVEGMASEYASGKATVVEFTLSMIALGETEGQRLYLAIKASHIDKVFHGVGAFSISK